CILMPTGVCSSKVVWQVFFERYPRGLLETSSKFPIHFLKIYKLSVVHLRLLSLSLQQHTQEEFRMDRNKNPQQNQILKSTYLCVWIILDPGHLARGVFKIMHPTAVALLDDLLPSTRQQLPKITTDCWVAHRIFY